MRKVKLNRKDKVLFAIPLFLLVLLLLARGSWMSDIWWAIHPRGDKLEKAARQLSGWGATDCGRVSSADAGGERTQADACSVAAIKAHRPFRVRYDDWGIDSVVYKGIVGTPKGEVYLLQYGSDVLGPSSALSQNLCPSPSIVVVKGHERIQCRYGEELSRPAPERREDIQTSTTLQSPGRAQRERTKELVQAVTYSDAFTVKWLLSQGADANAKDVPGTPLVLRAISQRNSDIAALLWKAGAETSLDSMLLIEAMNGHVNEVETLLRQGAKVNTPDEDGDAVLAYTAATRFDSPNIQSVIRLLVRHGAQVNARNKKGLTPLISAADQGSFHAVKALLHCGADVSAKDKEGDTALSCAQFLWAAEDREKRARTIRLLKNALARKSQSKPPTSSRWAPSPSLLRSGTALVSGSLTTYNHP
jgi:hypothetical protein